MEINNKFEIDDDVMIKHLPQVGPVKITYIHVRKLGGELVTFYGIEGNAEKMHNWFRENELSEIQE